MAQALVLISILFKGGMINADERDALKSKAIAPDLRLYRALAFYNFHSDIENFARLALCLLDDIDCLCLSSPTVSHLMIKALDSSGLHTDENILPPDSQSATISSPSPPSPLLPCL